MSKPAFTLDATRMFRAMKIADAPPSRHYLKGVRIEPIDPDAMLTAIGRSDLVAAKTVRVEPVAVEGRE